jgi:hypothetical protein
MVSTKYAMSNKNDLVGSFQAGRLASREIAQHSVHPTGGSLRVFKRFAWLGVGSGKIALSQPAHQRVTPTVRRFQLIPYM